MAIRDEEGGPEMLKRCLVRSWIPKFEADVTCAVCGHQHCQEVYEIYDPTDGRIIYPVGSKCIWSYTENTQEDRARALSVEAAKRKAARAELRRVRLQEKKDRERAAWRAAQASRPIGLREWDRFFDANPQLATHEGVCDRVSAIPWCSSQTLFDIEVEIGLKALRSYLS